MRHPLCRHAAKQANALVHLCPGSCVRRVGSTPGLELGLLDGAEPLLPARVPVRRGDVDRILAADERLKFPRSHFIERGIRGR